MLTAEYLDSISDDLVILYSSFELAVLEDIARRLRKMNYTTSTARFQIELLQESGLVYESIVKKIALYSGKSEKEVSSSFEDAMVKSMAFDDKIYRAAGLSSIPLGQSDTMLQLLEANIIKTNGTLSNLTMTTATNGQQLFRQAASQAHLQIQSGGFSFDQAYRNAINMVGREQLKVQYPTGATRSIESAMRNNLMTSINQTSGIVQNARMDELGVDLVQTTAHSGAREGEGYKGHANWQGKIFKRNGSTMEYRNFVEATGLGQVDGLLGANCRHSYFGYIPGTPTGYTEELLRSYKEPDVTYNGKTMSYYDGTQKLRYHESQIRNWKTRAKINESAGLDNSKELAKVRDWQSKTRDLVKQTGVKRDYTREAIAR